MLADVDSGTDPSELLLSAARTAFDVTISESIDLSAIQTRAVALILSKHQSVTNFLVALHIVESFYDWQRSRSTRKKGNQSKLKTRKYPISVLSHVFSTEINSFVKQMMASSDDLENIVATFVFDVNFDKRARQRKSGHPTIFKTQCCYFAGRVSELNKPKMVEFLRKMKDEEFPPREREGAVISTQLNTRDVMMLKRTIVISQSTLQDVTAERSYAELLLSNREEMLFNCGVYLEYYGDVRLSPTGHMMSKDDGRMPCDKTISRLRSRLGSVENRRFSLIEFVTFLGLTQRRFEIGRLHDHFRVADRNLITEVLQSDEGGILPPMVKGYASRIYEDLSRGSFDLGAMLYEWGYLKRIERTGWLRRRDTAPTEVQIRWKDVRIESVADHTIMAMLICLMFLEASEEDGQRIDRDRVLRMLFIHDLSEARLGDNLPGRISPQKEVDVMYEYAAFCTYNGVVDLWELPILLKEFNEKSSIDARVARDIDLLEFALQSRIYKDGIGVSDQESTESVFHSMTTLTVKQVFRQLKNFPIGDLRGSKVPPKVWPYDQERQT